MHIWQMFVIWGPYARYGVLKGAACCYMLNSAIADQANAFWKTCFCSEFVPYRPYIGLVSALDGAFATSKPGAAVSGCLRWVRIIIPKNEVFL